MEAAHDIFYRGLSAGAADPEGPQPQRDGPPGAGFAHLVTRAMKLVRADRSYYCGDPAFAEVQMTALLSESYAAQRLGQIAETASFDCRPGTLPGFEEQLSICGQVLGDLPGKGAVHAPTMAHLAEREARLRDDTCHLDGIDRSGNLVSVTPSGGWFQSLPVIRGRDLTSRPGRRCSG